MDFLCDQNNKKELFALLTSKVIEFVCPPSKVVYVTSGERVISAGPTWQYQYNVKNTYIVIHNGTENHFFTVNGRHFVFLRARKKISHGSPSNINQHTLSESHAKFDAFIRPVTVISLSHLTNWTIIVYSKLQWGASCEVHSQTKIHCLCIICGMLWCNLQSDYYWSCPESKAGNEELQFRFYCFLANRSLKRFSWKTIHLEMRRNIPTLMSWLSAIVPARSDGASALMLATQLLKSRHTSSFSHALW